MRLRFFAPLVCVALVTLTALAAEPPMPSAPPVVKDAKEPTPEERLAAGLAKRIDVNFEETSMMDAVDDIAKSRAS